MCLARVLETYDHPSSFIMDGWKDVGNAKKPHLQMSIKGIKDIPLDKWITATNEHAPKGIKADDGNMYEPGFHAYADEKQLKSAAKLTRVFLRGITCLGEQDNRATVIANEMYIPSDKNGWPPKPDTRTFFEKAKDILPGNA